MFPLLRDSEYCFEDKTFPLTKPSSFFSLLFKGGTSGNKRRKWKLCLLDKEITILERLVSYLTVELLWEGQETLRQEIIQRWLGFMVGRLL